MKNMLSRFIICLFYYLLIQSVTGQNYIVLEEERLSGKTFSIPHSGPAIVDINSIIRIKVERSEVERKMFSMQGISPSDERLDQLQRLNDLLKTENQIMSLLDGRQLTSEDRMALNEFKIALYEDILTDEDLAEEIESEPVEALAANFDGPYIAFVIDYLNMKADSLRQNILQDLGLNMNSDSAALVYFRLGAFIKNKQGGRAVHVENFDDLDLGPFVDTKDFFGQPLGPAEREALDEQKEIGQNLRKSFEDNTTKLSETIKVKAKELFTANEAFDTLRSVRAETLLEFRQDEKKYKEAISVVEASQPEMDRVSNLYTSISSVFNELSGRLSPELISEGRFFKLLDELESAVNDAYNSFVTRSVAYKTSPASFSDAVESLNLVGNTYKEYTSAVEKDLTGARDLLDNVRSILNIFRKPYLESEEFSEKVNRFTYGGIPENGIIELRYIGERRTGDEILIKAVLEKGNDTRMKGFEETELYRRYITIERVAPHIRMSGSLILASPMNREKVNPDLKSFQFAPTYGIFLKWGSRKSHFYNNVANFGIGLGFSSPDFNLDGTPEFGSGLMITGFNDIISAGFGYNFGVDTPYSFVGFNIPFSVGGLPTTSLSSSTVVE